MFVPAYGVLLREHGVRAVDVRDVETFSRVCPLLSKVNTFDRFTLPELTVGGRLQDVGEVLTSSGHGGRFSFGVISRAEAAASASFVDAALDAAFAVKSRKTLAINCLPMGVSVSSHCMTVATTSVREDMAVALVKTFGADYDQILLIGDPLFMKRFTDHALEQLVDWRRHRVGVVVGEETFGEHFRKYIGDCLGLEPDRPGGGHIMSSFGVAELGLHLCFETAATAALVRRHAVEPLARGGAARRQASCRRLAPDRARIRPAAHVHRGAGPRQRRLRQDCDFDARSLAPGAAAALPDGRRRPASRSATVWPACCAPTAWPRARSPPRCWRSGAG